jgi:hypothetical protein
VPTSALPFGDDWLQGGLEDAEFAASAIVDSSISEATTYHRLGVTLLQYAFASKVFLRVIIIFRSARVEFCLRASAFFKVSAILDVQRMRAIVEASSNLCRRHLMQYPTCPRGLPIGALLVGLHSHQAVRGPIPRHRIALHVFLGQGVRLLLRYPRTIDQSG